MTSTHRVRNTACVVLFAALTTTFAACASEESDTPSTTTTTTTTSVESSAPAPSPTEKSINPTGGNLFTPSITAPGPPTPAPGNLPGNSPK